MAQENGHEQYTEQRLDDFAHYTGSIVRALTGYVSRPFEAVGQQITDRLGAFSAALGDASIPNDYVSKNAIKATSFRLHPVRAMRKAATEFLDALEYEAVDDACLVESPDRDDEVVVETRSFLSRLAIGLGIETINDRPKQ